MEAFPMSTVVKNPKHEGPDLIEPLKRAPRNSSTSTAGTLVAGAGFEAGRFSRADAWPVLKRRMTVRLPRLDGGHRQLRHCSTIRFIHSTFCDCSEGSG